MNYGVVGIVAFVIVFAAYLFLSTSTTTTSSTATTSTTGQVVTGNSGSSIPAGAVVVDIPNLGGYEYAQYTPAQITVILGVNATVAWTNHDVIIHNMIATNGAFNSGDVAPGSTFVFTFTQAGTYTYYCSYHASMSGVVVVKSS